MNIKYLVKRITLEEAISHRIKQIEDEGNTTAKQAKITRLGEEQAKAEKILQAVHSMNLSHYIGAKLNAKVISALNSSIEEYKETKEKLSEAPKKNK